ncbi:MAG: hypothetical protein J6N78_06220 [Clostridia bacterium]|nr:hypothetical protein [Clostridia bacterium]
MDYLKVFVVTNKKAFNEYFKENRNSDLSKIFDEINDSEIHLVPVNVPNELTMRYTGYNPQEYNVYINQSEKWQRAAFGLLSESDIDCLIESRTIEDYEEYRHWKKVDLYQVTDKEKFINYIYDRLSDSEKIAIKNNSNKAGEQQLFIIEIEDEFSDNYDYKVYIKFENSNIAHIFPDITLDDNDIFALSQSTIKSLDCKLHDKYKNLSINDSKDYILLTEREGYGFPKVIFRNNMYIARTFLRDEKKRGYMPLRVQAFGSTRKEALEKLKEKIEEIEKSEKQIHSSKDDGIEDLLEEHFFDY